MFDDVLLEHAHGIQNRRGMSAFMSFTLEAAIVAMVIIIPLMITQTLPVPELSTMLVAPPPPAPPPPPAAATQATRPPVVKTTTTQLDALRTPTKIPQTINTAPEPANPAPPSEVAGVPGGVAGGVEGGTPGGVLGGILNSGTAPPPPKLERVKVSQGVTQGLLIHKVEPQYPAIARQARIQGTVVLNAIISRQGQIQNLKVISGSPMLVPAAIQAVKQWRYKPYVLNGNPVEVETSVTVNFNLSNMG
ncbi:MAG TPA: TonB family protein [Terriglobales bacterium]|nr:TonB family protein [Terriglobales bacterium]